MADYTSALDAAIAKLEVSDAQHTLWLGVLDDLVGELADRVTALETPPPPPPPPPSTTVGKMYGGISLPLAQNPDTDIDRMAADGFGWLRADLRIASISPTRGTFNWGPTDAWVSHAVAKGLKVLPIVYMLPSWMNGSSNDKAPPVVNQDYADWCATAANHLAPLGVTAMELWNEQNLSGFWPNPDRVRYVTMANLAADAIHAAVPAMTVVSGGVSTADTQYQANVKGVPGFTSTELGCYCSLDCYGFLGLYAHVDAVGIHPYLDGVDPSNGGDNNWCQWAGNSIRRCLTIIDRWAPAGKKLTVWNTESAAPRISMSATEQANRVAHAMQAFTTWTLADGSPMRARLGPYSHFTYRDWTNASEPRARTFGLVDGAYAPWPAHTAIKTELAQVVA